MYSTFAIVIDEIFAGLENFGLVSKRLIGFGVVVLVGTTANAHGESAPGPHGGEIRMPGAFHTEAKVEGRAVVVRLLDIQFKNPTTRNSVVEARLDRDGKAASLSCKAEKDRFNCALPKGEMAQTGRLFVKANRDGAPGAEVSYDLPLGKGFKNQ